MLMRTPHRWVRPKRLHPPGFVAPCQPTLAHTVPAGDGWIHELKHDGFRILAFKDGDTVRLWSRNGRDWSGEFVAISAAMRALPCKRVTLLLRFSEHLSAEQGEAMYRHACAMGLEGIVSKRITSRYESGSCRSRVATCFTSSLSAAVTTEASAVPSGRSR